MFSPKDVRVFSKGYYFSASTTCGKHAVRNAVFIKSFEILEQTASVHRVDCQHGYLLYIIFIY